jgi:hypothetical protein
MKNFEIFLVFKFLSVMIYDMNICCDEVNNVNIAYAYGDFASMIIMSYLSRCFIYVWYGYKVREGISSSI